MQEELDERVRRTRVFKEGRASLHFREKPLKALQECLVE